MEDFALMVSTAKAADFRDNKGDVSQIGLRPAVKNRKKQ